VVYGQPQTRHSCVLRDLAIKLSLRSAIATTAHHAKTSRQNEASLTLDAHVLPTGDPAGLDLRNNNALRTNASSAVC
jgi:hypothetical protein